MTDTNRNSAASVPGTQQGDSLAPAESREAGNLFDNQRDMLERLAAAELAGLSASTVNGCDCDFCTGRKKHDDNWCACCGEVKLRDDQWWENMDVCDACDARLREAVP